MNEFRQGWCCTRSKEAQPACQSVCLVSASVFPWTHSLELRMQSRNTIIRNGWMQPGEKLNLFSSRDGNRLIESSSSMEKSVLNNKVYLSPPKQRRILSNSVPQSEQNIL